MLIDTPQRQRMDWSAAIRDHDLPHRPAGGTSFPKLDLTVPSRAGRTLWFRNCDDQGAIDRRTLHAGDTVRRGEKWVVTK